MLCAVIAACVFAVALGGCADQAQPSESTTEVATQASSSASASETSASTSSESEASSSTASAKSRLVPLEKPDSDTLYALLDEEVADMLIKRAKRNEDDAWIAAHPDAYAVFREHIQVKSLTLAANEPLAAKYVRDLPEKFPAEKPSKKAPAMSTELRTDKVPKTDVPHYYQWDLRWGYTMYDGDAFGLSGCGPTAMAMVYAGLTGEDDKTPYDMGQLAFEGDFVDPDYGGTYDGYYPYAAERLGLQFESIPVGADSIAAALGEGKVMIAHVGPGSFSQIGHFIVLAGLADSGKVIVNDPYSPTRSAKLWDAGVIAAEAYALYAYSLPEE